MEEISTALVIEIGAAPQQPFLHRGRMLDFLEHVVELDVL
jgi:hypothetical protein